MLETVSLSVIFSLSSNLVFVSKHQLRYLTYCTRKNDKSWVSDLNKCSKTNNSNILTQNFTESVIAIKMHSLK